MTHPITDDLAENLQARAPVQGEPVYWEWRHLSTHPDTVDFGKWSEWKRVEARSAIHTIDDELAEFRTYIAQGHKYELRALYTAPQPAHAAQAEVTDEQILSLDCVSIDSDEHGTSFWVDRSTVIKFARAILALRPERVPMTDEEATTMIRETVRGNAIRREGSTSLQIVRATEAYYGIKPKEQA